MPRRTGTGHVCPRVGAPGGVPGSECGEYGCGMESVRVEGLGVIVGNVQEINVGNVCVLNVYSVCLVCV